MDFNNALAPAVMPEHRPSYYYLYKRARPYLYAPTRADYGVALHDNGHSDYFLDRGRLNIDRGPQTVEDLLQQGYFAAPVRNTETALLLDRQDASWLALDDALTQIRQRHEIYRQNMLELEWAQCYAFNELARHGWPASEEQYALYQRRLQDLHAEQRLERVRLWSDVSRVRQLVPPSVQQYVSALRKSEILGVDRGEQP